MSSKNKEIEIRQRLKDDFVHYAEKCLKIRTKSGKSNEPYVLNRAQRYLHNKLEAQRQENGRIRAIILKGRQQGCSTYVEGRFYWRVTHSFGVRAYILTHLDQATDNLYRMVRRFHDNCPYVVKPSTSRSNAKELIFDKLDSGYRIGTAKSEGVGRSDTIQFFHGSEVASWSNAAQHAEGIFQAVPNEIGTEVILESTARGMDNYFHQFWEESGDKEHEYLRIFIPWYWQSEYQIEPPEDFVRTSKEEELAKIYDLSDSQIFWRRRKIKEFSAGDGEKSFKQEYPCNAEEAFQHSNIYSFIKTELVMAARKEVNVSMNGPLLLGVDPARGGPDRTAIIRRRGRVAYKLETHRIDDTMKITGIIVNIIKNEHPDYVFIDVGGLGSGIVDRLRELGFSKYVFPANFAEKAFKNEKYYNKRIEMWGELENWLQDKPVSIPDSDELHRDLCSLSIEYDSNSRYTFPYKLERKVEAAKREGYISPDCADALALTFAFPVSQDRKKPMKQDTSYIV